MSYIDSQSRDTPKLIFKKRIFFLQYSVLISQLSDRAKSIVRELDGTNELVYLRIQSKKHEILVAPEEDFILIVVQDPSKKPEKDEV